MKLHLKDGEAFVEGRSPEKARELLAAAKEAGIDQNRVQTTSSGYIVPAELVEGGGNTDASTPALGGDPDGASQPGTQNGEVNPDNAPAGDAATVDTDTKPAADTDAVNAAIDASDDLVNTDVEKAAAKNEREAPVEADTVTAESVFDPADHTIPEVEAYLETADDAERTRVLDAERSGKARKAFAETEGAE